MVNRVTTFCFESMDSTTFKKDAGRKKFILAHERNGGAPCLKCGPEKCDGGLDLHFWRKICKTCKCKPEEHDLKSAEEEAHEFVVNSLFSKDSTVGHIRDYFRKLEEANNTQRTEYAKQFAWCPPGLEERLLKKYMDALPLPVRPKVGSDGAEYRRKQMMFQLPIHDHDEIHCCNLTEPEKGSMRKFCEDRNRNALGVGEVREKTNPVWEWVCYRCGTGINLGEVAVFASRAGESKCWHPGCFVCSICNNILVDLIYFHKDGDIYCGRHYAELHKPRCEACDELIYAEGRALEAMGKNWHQNHLCCDHCDEPLSQQNFVTVDGKPSCTDCYDKNFAKKCENCGEVIGPGEEEVDVHGKHWHQGCSICSQPECKKPLESSCSNDKLTSHPSCKPIAHEVCDGCGGDFAQGETKIVYQSKNFHGNCFTCAECKEPLGTQQFVRRDGKNFCETCADAGYDKICVRCNERIKSAWVENHGKTYHTECFVCSMCSQSLAGKTFKEHAGNKICHDCYRDNYAKRCGACQLPIEESVMFVAYDKEFFHRDCFNCAMCGMALELEKFYLVGNYKTCVSCGS